MTARASRSSLIFPVHVPRFLERAWTRNVDTITLDLEDAVNPDQKPYARTLMKDAIGIASRGGSEIAVRINHDAMLEDCEASVWPGLKTVSYPKAESKEEIQELDRIITRLEKERGIPQGTIEIRASIETAWGVWNAPEIVTASPRIKNFGGFAAGDGTADLGVRMEDQRFMDVLGYGGGETDLVARALSKRPSRGGKWRPNAVITGDFGEEAARQVLGENRARWRRGDHSGGGIHPSTVEPANQAFTPSQDDLQEAQEVIEAYRVAYDAGRGFGVYRGRVITAQVADAAQELLDYAKACEERDKEKAEAQERTREATTNWPQGSMWVPGKGWQQPPSSSEGSSR